MYLFYLILSIMSPSYVNIRVIYARSNRDCFSWIAINWKLLI